MENDRDSVLLLNWVMEDGERVSFSDSNISKSRSHESFELLFLVHCEERQDRNV